MLLIFVYAIPAAIPIVGGLLLARHTRRAWGELSTAVLRCADPPAVRRVLLHRIRRSQLLAILAATALAVALAVTLPQVALRWAVHRDRGALSIEEAYAAVSRAHPGPVAGPWGFVISTALPMVTCGIVLIWLTGELFAIRTARQALTEQGFAELAASLQVAWGRVAVAELGLGGALLSLAFGGGLLYVAFNAAASAIACAQPGGSKCM